MELQVSGSCVLIRKERGGLAPSVCPVKRKEIDSHLEIRRSSPEPHHASTLMSDLEPHKLIKTTSLHHFVRLTDTDQSCTLPRWALLLLSCKPGFSVFFLLLGPNF